LARAEKWWHLILPYSYHFFPLFEHVPLKFLL
jgi:hypothetical protein